MDWRFSTFLLALFALLIGFSVAPISETMCSSSFVLDVLSQHNKDGAANCFDFWLNRYQGLIGAVISLAAIVAAWIAVQAQIKVANTQAAIAMGDVPPDFFLWGAELNPLTGISTIEIHINNNNRLAIHIDRIHVDVPSDIVFITMERRQGDKDRHIWFSRQPTGYGLSEFIEGTRPSASEVTQAVIRLKPIFVPKRLPREQLLFQYVKLKIRYSYKAPQSKSYWIALECGIAMH